MQDAPLLIETLGWDGQRLVRRTRHMARLAASAAALGYAHDAEAVARILDSVEGSEPLRVRLTLDRQGGLDLTTAPMGPTAALWRVALAPDRLDASDPWLRHKTTRRALYDRWRAALPQGVDEVLFANQTGQMAEGTITNLFFAASPFDDAPLFTPPLSDGCLPGCLRAELLATGKCTERALAVDDLGDISLYCGNSLRGLIPAQLVTLEGANDGKSEGPNTGPNNAPNVPRDIKAD